MSVLANPQGLPERVWSLTAGLRALGGRTDRTTFEALINPGFTKDGLPVQTKAELARDTFSAASSLKLVKYDGGDVVLCVDLASAEQLADHLSDHLANLAPGDSNSIIFDAYAWVFVESDRQGDLGWVYDLDRKAFADQIKAALVGQEPMNETKLVPWRRWLAFLGLGVPLPLTNAADFPSPASRIEREIRRAGFPLQEEIPALRFLTILAERMPYLDGGRLFAQASQQIGHVTRPRTLSLLLSAALWDLHDERTIALRPRGDSTDAFKLSGDSSHEIQTFNSVVVKFEGDL